MSANETLERSFDVGPSPYLSISNVHGSILVRGEARQDVQIKAVKYTQETEHPERTEIEMEQDGDRIVVKTRYQRDKEPGDRRRGDRICPVDYVAVVPIQCDLDLSHVNGTVQVNQISGRVQANAVNGLVQLAEIDGRTRVNLVNAELQGRAWEGRANVSTVSGQAHLDDLRLTRLKASTVSGRLVLDAQDKLADDSRYDLSSVSGDVTLYLPKDQGIVSRGSSLSGRLRCSLPHQFTKKKFGGWRATVNQGGPPVRFSSISGDLRVREHEPAVQNQ